MSKKTESHTTYREVRTLAGDVLATELTQQALDETLPQLTDGCYIVRTYHERVARITTQKKVDVTFEHIDLLPKEVVNPDASV